MLAYTTLCLQRALLTKLVRENDEDKRKQLIINTANESSIMLDAIEDDQDNDGHSEVSDHYDSASLSSDNELLDDIIEPSKSPHKADPSSDPGHGPDKNSILHAEYGEDEPPPKLPPVSELLAKTVSKWLHVTSNRDQLKVLFHDCLIPDNVEGLQQVRINKILYQTLLFKAKLTDQKLCGINNFVIRGVGPLISVLDTLVSAEEALIKCKESVQGPLKVSTVELNIPQLCRQVHSAVHLLSVCNSVILTKCKSEIKIYLHPKYHYLTKPSNPVTDELLGPNVEQKVNDSNKLYEAGRKLGCSSRGFRFFNQVSRYRGRNSSFRGNRFTPYQNN